MAAACGVAELLGAAPVGLARRVRPPPDLPARIPVMLGGMIAVRCPAELAPLMRRAGGLWEPGSRRWLIERRRIRAGPAGAPAHDRSAVPAGRTGPGRRVMPTCSAMTTKRSSTASVQRRRDKMRAMGLRPVQIWVPDTNAPGFAAEAARQGRLLAEWEASPAGREEMAFWDALASEAWDEPD